MKCVNDIEMMEYISGRLTPDKREQVKKHLAECSKCSELFQESSRLWETLGKWNVDTSSHNIADRVMASVRKSVSIEKKTKIHIIKRGFWIDALRIAALIVIAVGVGQKLGKISAGQNTITDISSQTEPKYIAALGLDLSGDFTWLLTEDNSSEQENQ